jgi:hypothetical protein
MPPVRSVHLATAADARAARDTGARTTSASASGNSTRSAEIRQQHDASSKTRRVPAKIVSARWRHGAIGCQRQSLVIHRRSGWIAGPRRSVTASPLQTGYGLCLKRREPATTPGSLQECSSIGRAPVSKTGGRRFEPCHSCQLNQGLSRNLYTGPALGVNGRVNRAYRKAV